MLVPQLVNGVTLGAQYSLIVVGLSLIFSVVGIANFAQGEIFMVSAFILLGLEEAGLPYSVAGVLTVVAAAGVGGLFYGLVVRPVVERGWQSQIIATLATSLLLVNLAIVVMGSLPRLTSSPLTGTTVSVAGSTVSVQRILVLGATAVAFVLFGGLLRRSKVGAAMRAVSQNREAAVIMGLPVHRVELYAVVLGCMMTAVAAVLVSPLGNVTPTMGSMLTLKAFAAIVMGGFGNLLGPVVSAFAIGLIEVLASGYVSSAYADAIVFAVMIVVLVARPRGLFGKAVRA